MQASSGRTAAIRAIHNLPTVPVNISQQRAETPASNHRVPPAPPIIAQQTVSPVPGVSVTQQVSFLENYLAQHISPVASSSSSNYLTGYVPGELSRV